MGGSFVKSSQSDVECTGHGGGPAKSLGVAASLAEATSIRAGPAHNEKYPAQAAVVANRLGPAGGELSTRKNGAPRFASDQSAGEFKAVNDGSTETQEATTSDTNTGAFQRATTTSKDSRGLKGFDPHDSVQAEDWLDIADILQAQPGRGV